MKKPMDVKVKSIIVLTVICLVVTALLAVTNYFTEPVIEAGRQQKVQDSLKAAIPDAESFEELGLPANAPGSVVAVYRADNGGYAVVLAVRSSYSSGDMGITVGIKDGAVVNAVLTSYFESKDFGQDTYPAEFIGRTENDYAEIDDVGGVTYSSRVFKGAVGDAFTVVEMITGGESE